MCPRLVVFVEIRNVATNQPVAVIKRGWLKRRSLAGFEVGLGQGMDSNLRNLARKKGFGITPASGSDINLTGWYFCCIDNSHERLNQLFIRMVTPDLRR